MPPLRPAAPRRKFVASMYSKRYTESRSLQILVFGMSRYYLFLHNVSVHLGSAPILQSVNLRMDDDQHWAIVGPSASGKTTLAQALAGERAYLGKMEASFAEPDCLAEEVELVEQQHRFKNLANRSDFYYQQRYNAMDADQTVTVQEDLRLHGLQAGGKFGIFAFSDLIELLRLGHLMQEPLIQLSSGENKRLQIMKALLRQPQLLILDQPFAGLDPQGRKLIHALAGDLVRSGARILLITSPSELPDYVTHVAVLEQGRLVAAMPKAEFKASTFCHYPASNTWHAWGAHDQIDDDDFTFAVRLKEVNIKYKDKWILRNINWEVRRSQRWSLSGPNGAGKSTLLSLLVGDNPQAYANEIYLFDRRRGTGESIWDIKRRIGYVSSELHLYFDPSVTCFEVVASGLFDTIGLFRHPSSQQAQRVKEWIEAFGLHSSQDKLIRQLGLGQQRMALLARALVKSPPVLVLDEPCQGLDQEQIARVRSLLDDYCERKAATLIYVSHYAEEIPSCVNHFLTLDQGQITSCR
jgi:molybdate transport system ATP-binding protein